MSVGMQVVWLFVLSLPVASVAWTVTHEEVFREPREYCKQRSQNDHSIWSRKFFYLFTCEYCFSHYVALGALFLTGYKLLYQDWRGYVLAFFALPFVANIYIGLFGQVKLGVKKERTEIKALQEDVEIKALERNTKEATERRGVHQSAA
jgi:amino acid permease